MAPTRTPRKLKRTFSLSREALDCLERMRKEHHLPSASAALDQLIRAKKVDEENKRISASVTNYYDLIGEEEMEESRTWGQFAETQFPEG
jgi:hypothetical protein